MKKLVFGVGALGLLGAMALDFAAVLGRRSGLPLVGSIELSELCIVCMASASLLSVTLERGHASVHLLTERLPARAKHAFARTADLLSAVFFAFVLAGSLLLVFDLWHGAEQSELLQLPIMPLRVLWCASLVGIAGCFAIRAWKRQAAG